MFKKIIDKIVKFLNPNPYEAYLNRATDLNDLENRIKALQNGKQVY